MTSNTIDCRFEGFVLLRENAWDTEAFIAQYYEDWGVALSWTKPKDGDTTILTAHHEGMDCTIALIPSPLPQLQAEQAPRAKYLWEEVVTASERSTAYLVVSVSQPEGVVPFEVACLWSRLMASLLVKGDNVVAVWDGLRLNTDIEDYRDYSLTVEVEPPLLLWVAMCQQEYKGNIIYYTEGLKRFGYDELELSHYRGGEIEVEELLEHLVWSIIIDERQLGGLTEIEVKGTRLSLRHGKGQLVEGNSYQLSLPLDWRATKRTLLLKNWLLLILGILGMGYAGYLFSYSEALFNNDDVLYWWEIPYAFAELLFGFLGGWGVGKWFVALLVGIPSFALMLYATRNKNAISIK